MCIHTPQFIVSNCINLHLLNDIMICFLLWYIISWGSYYKELCPKISTSVFWKLSRKRVNIFFPHCLYFESYLQGDPKKLFSTFNFFLIFSWVWGRSPISFVFTYSIDLPKTCSRPLADLWYLAPETPESPLKIFHNFMDFRIYNFFSNWFW